MEKLQEAAENSQDKIKPIMDLVRDIGDINAGVVEQRQFLNNYTSYDGGKSYSQYTVLKMMKAYKEDVQQADKEAIQELETSNAQLLQQNKELREALETKWINVKDRLPEEGGRYWCYVEGYGDLGVYHYQWNCSYDPHDNKFWDRHLDNGDKATHWMPLPESPIKTP